MNRINPFLRNFIIGVICMIILISAIPLYLYVEHNVYTYDKITAYTHIESHLNGYRKILYKKTKNLPNHPYMAKKDGYDFYFNDEYKCLIDKSSQISCLKETTARRSQEELIVENFHKIKEDFYVKDPSWYYINDSLKKDSLEQSYGVYYQGYIRIQTDTYVATINVMCNDPLDSKCIKFVCESVADYINKNTIDFTTVDWIDQIDSDAYY